MVLHALNEGSFMQFQLRIVDDITQMLILMILLHCILQHHLPAACYRLASKFQMVVV
jgi:hypothetical protein